MQLGASCTAPLHTAGRGAARIAEAARITEETRKAKEEAELAAEAARKGNDQPSSVRMSSWKERREPRCPTDTSVPSTSAKRASNMPYKADSSPSEHADLPGRLWPQMSRLLPFLAIQRAVAEGKRKSRSSERDAKERACFETLRGRCHIFFAQPRTSLEANVQ